MSKLALVLGVVTLLAIPVSAYAQDAHARGAPQHGGDRPVTPPGKAYCGHLKYHTWYDKHKTKNGGSCCNGHDCACAAVRPEGAGWLVQTHENGPWRFVDTNSTKIFLVETPDGSAHACIRPNGEIPCLFVGTGG
jgi:hypothetical protein